MHSEPTMFSGKPQRSSALGQQPGIFSVGLSIPRKAIIGGILIVALIAFEIFNFDTTRYALQSLLGDVSFARVQWAVILAVAFCAIDFAGLARLFTPERGNEEPRAVWYLMGAWLLGATMNAVMTWWAVNLTLLNHEFGNEVLSRAQLLKIVPLFVAVLVWLTRILFIGAFAVAGEHLFDSAGEAKPEARPTAVANLIRPQRQPATTPQPLPAQAQAPDAAPVPTPVRTPRPEVQRRPPTPGSVRPTPVPMQAQSRRAR